MTNRIPECDPHCTCNDCIVDHITQQDAAIAADPFAGWTQAAVGCHWTKGPYAASTISQGNRSGYVLVRDRERIAEFITWAEVQRLTVDA